jgi:TPR repeat protein
LPKAKADQYFQEALKAQLPKACLEQARTLLDDRKADPEPYLRCAAPSLPEAQYLLGRFILNHTAAEDEPHRFEGLAWLALAAKAGYSPAIRRWELLAADLPFEDLERVEQKSQMLVTR